MIIMFGPAGAGKSVQGQMLAARMNWRWLSAGQLLRDTKDIELLKQMQTGELVDPKLVNDVMLDALNRAKGSVDSVILDGFPRQLEQAEWLVESRSRHERDIQLVIVFELPQSEIQKRLAIRGRLDDTPEVIEKRILIYRQEMYPVLAYLTDKNVRVVHIDATGSVGQVHDRIVTELVACNLA